MRKVPHILPVLLGLLLSACDVHELPEEGFGVTVSVALQFPDVMPTYRTLSYTKAGEAQVPRYTVQVFRYGADDRLEAEPVWSEQFSGEQISRLDTTLAVPLSQQRFRVLSWVDYTAGGRAFWRADDFSKISLDGDYTGNEDGREAFCGSLELDLRDVRPREDLIIEEVIRMQRPVARVQFFVADKETFLARAGAAGLAGWRAVLSYPAFLPDSYSLLEERTVDARSGVSFEGRVEQTSSGEISIGFDYVLVNGPESAVTMALTLYDPDGKAAGSLPATNIPVARGQRTLVWGDYFTGSGGGGVAIDPGFGGDIDIELQ